MKLIPSSIPADIISIKYDENLTVTAIPELIIEDQSCPRCNPRRIAVSSALWLSCTKRCVEAAYARVGRVATP